MLTETSSGRPNCYLNLWQLWSKWGLNVWYYLGKGLCVLARWGCVSEYGLKWNPGFVINPFLNHARFCDPFSYIGEVYDDFVWETFADFLRINYLWPLWGQHVSLTSKDVYMLLWCKCIALFRGIYLGFLGFKCVAFFRSYRRIEVKMYRFLLECICMILSFSWEGNNVLPAKGAGHVWAYLGINV